MSSFSSDLNKLTIIISLLAFLCRLTFADPPPSRSGSLLKMGSKFRYSDRTLYQMRKDGEPIKNQPRFERVSSRNWSRRYQMPSLSETRIYVDDKDDENKAKRPLSEGDLPSNVPLYAKVHKKQVNLLDCIITLTPAVHKMPFNK